MTALLAPPAWRERFADAGMRTLQDVLDALTGKLASTEIAPSDELDGKVDEIFARYLDERASAPNNLTLRTLARRCMDAGEEGAGEGEVRAALEGA